MLTKRNRILIVPAGREFESRRRPISLMQNMSKLLHQGCVSTLIFRAIALLFCRGLGLDPLTTNICANVIRESSSRTTPTTPAPPVSIKSHAGLSNEAKREKGKGPRESERSRAHFEVSGGGPILYAGKYLQSRRLPPNCELVRKSTSTRFPL